MVFLSISLEKPMGFSLDRWLFQRLGVRLGTRLRQLPAALTQSQVSPVGGLKCGKPR